MQPATQESRDRFARRGISTRLRQIFSFMDANSDGKIDKNELRAFLQRMGYSPPKSIIENIIWEVDEDHDGQICLVEFENSYQRCSTDANGTEPRQLYNVILFLLHSDGAGGAKMSAEEAARLMYLQFGREGMDAELESTFGKKESPQDLTLEDFLRAITARDIRVRPKKGRRPVPVGAHAAPRA